MTKFFGVFGEFFLGVVRQQRGQLGPACWHGTDGEAKESATEPGFPRAGPVTLAHPQATAQFHDLAAFGLTPLPGQVQRFAHGKQTHSRHGHLDTVEQLGAAKGESRLPGLQVHAHHAEQQAQAQRDQAAQHGVAQHGRHRDHRQHHQAKVFGRAKRQGRFNHPWRHKSQGQGADGAGHKAADGRRGQGLASSAATGHFVAFQGRDDRRRLARGVEQNRGG